MDPLDQIRARLAAAPKDWTLSATPTGARIDVSAAERHPFEQAELIDFLNFVKQDIAFLLGIVNNEAQDAHNFE